MLLQYPKLGSAPATLHYDDFRILHQSFIKVYKGLYEDVAGFSLLPERFIKEAGPVIENFLSDSAAHPANNDPKGQLQAVAEFISRFYSFMDEATEMFMEHQALCDKTVTYMETVASLNQQYDGDLISEHETEYVQLIPELKGLNEKLNQVRRKVDGTAEDLNKLKPVWDQIKANMAQA